MVTALDPTYVSSMSWAFILVFGLNQLLALFLADSKTIEEMEMMAMGGGMMAQQNAAQPKDFGKLFKAEKDFYEIMSYKFALEDVEEAFILKHKNGGTLTK